MYPKLGKWEGFQIHKPRLDTSRDWKAAYGLECIRIWKRCLDHLEQTGEELDCHYPTEEEFREARKAFNKKSIYKGG